MLLDRYLFDRDWNRTYEGYFKDQNGRDLNIAENRWVILSTKSKCIILQLEAM